MKAFLRLFLLSCLLYQGGLLAETMNTEEAAPPSQETVQPEQLPPTEVIAPETHIEASKTAPAEEARPTIPTYEGAFFKMIVVLVSLLFIIFFFIWIMRRFTQHRIRLFNQAKHIKIIERRPLSPKTALYIIEIGEKRVLVAESQLEVKTLATLEDFSSSVAPKEG